MAMKIIYFFFFWNAMLCNLVDAYGTRGKASP